jgi:hypothetical protein
MTYSSARSPFLLVAAFALALPLKAQVADAGPDQWICGDSAYLNAYPPGPLQWGTWSVASGSAVFTAPSSPNSEVTGLTYGNNELVWTLTDGFTTTTDTVLIIAYDPFAPAATTYGDTVLYGPPFTTTLYANAPVYPQFCNWTHVTGTGIIWTSSNYQTTVSNLAPGASNAFQWACENGPCGVTVSVWSIVVYYSSVGLMEGQALPPFVINTSAGTISLVTDKRPDSFWLIDGLGQQVSTNNLPSGPYTAVALVDGKRYVQRFIVAR